MSPSLFMQRDGEVIYRTVCQGCHMANAQGAGGAGAYPALANNPKLAEAEYPVLVVVNGAKGMPPFGKLLGDEQVAAVVNYVRSHFGNT
jgi:mono/diheme cytochrome c family protein